MTNQPGLLLVISGPSGAGKTTIARELETRFEAMFSVSATTRPKTATDTVGVDYYFLSEEQFNAKKLAGDFLEHAEVFGSHQYGTPREPVEQQLEHGKTVILEIDVQGARQVKNAMPEAYMIFILPPDDEELLNRLRGRGRDDEQAIQRRYAEAKNEIETARSCGQYDAFIVNDNLETAIDEASKLVESRRASIQAKSC